MQGGDVSSLRQYVPRVRMSMWTNYKIIIQINT
jgi:hypothetical protein